VRAAGDRSIRVTLKPITFAGNFPDNPAIAGRAYPAPALSLREIMRPVRKSVGSLDVEVRAQPLTLIVRRAGGTLVQEVAFEEGGNLSFKLDDQPVLGMGEGGPRPAPGRPWREQPVQFDRRGQLDAMEPRWQSDMYGSRNPVAMLLGTAGWGLFVATPWVQVDLRNPDRGLFLPWKPTGGSNAPQTERNQQQDLGKGLPPVDAIIPGLYDFFVFDAQGAHCRVPAAEGEFDGRRGRLAQARAVRWRHGDRNSPGLRGRGLRQGVHPGTASTGRASPITGRIEIVATSRLLRSG
jgi:alpha-glucosidase/alpha-D-xyloside xylohydrolase